MKNNKGFAISGIIYSMIILFLMLMLLILMMLSSRKVILDKQKTNALNDINGTEEQLALYKEAILNGAYPELYEGLVPITIEDKGTVKKADTTKMWYNYQNKRWANAVILFGEDNYSAGDTIPESNIKQYFVWIPRYRYQLWNVNSGALYPNGNSESPINIVFENKTSVPSNGTTNGEWLTHPAFTNFNTNGLWVGKFETSYNESTFTDSSTFLTTNPNYTNATNAGNLIIKPNVRSLTGRNVSTFYTLLKSSNTNSNSHMMTNIEWGAATYLTYSNYGRCNNNSCEEVTINNINTGYNGLTQQFTGQWENGPTITGCAGDTVSAAVISNSNSCTNKYNTEKGYLASTTGNISGIYDMSGGSWEYVMGVVSGYTGYNSDNNSGFNGIYGCPTCNGNTSGLTSHTTGINLPTDLRYYDIYTPTSNTYDYSVGKLGDATREASSEKISLWFDDSAQIIIPTTPWVVRGGYHAKGVGAGITTFERSGGGKSAYYSARMVLAK